MFYPENVLGENPEQAEYTIVIVFTGFMVVFLGYGKWLIDKRMVLCLMRGTITRITGTQLHVSARAILRHRVSMNIETLRRQKHYSCASRRVAGLST